MRPFVREPAETVGRPKTFVGHGDPTLQKPFIVSRVAA
jgi:hypothetical protein